MKMTMMTTTLMQMRMTMKTSNQFALVDADAHMRERLAESRIRHADTTQCSPTPPHPLQSNTTVGSAKDCSAKHR